MSTMMRVSTAWKQIQHACVCLRTVCFFKICQSRVYDSSYSLQNQDCVKLLRWPFIRSAKRQQMYGSLIYSCGPAKPAIHPRCYQRFDDVRAGRALMTSMGMPSVSTQKNGKQNPDGSIQTLFRCQRPPAYHDDCSWQWLHGVSM